MNQYRQRKHQRASSALQNAFTPVIGPLDRSTTLQCQVPFQSQQHVFRCKFSHPLNCLLKIFQKNQKQALKVLLQSLYDIKISETNIFWPQALLKGQDEINQAYLNHIKNTRINSYIKTNIRSSSMSQTKRKPNIKLNESPYIVDKRLSSTNNPSRINQYNKRQMKNKSVNKFSHSNHIDQNNLYQINVKNNYQQRRNITNINQSDIYLTNQKRTNVRKSNSKENIKHYLGMNQITTAEDQSPQFKRSPQHKDDSLNPIQQTHRHVTNITNIKNIIKSTTKKMKKSSNKADLKISVSYTVVNNKTQNPVNSRYLYKSQASQSHSKKAPSHFANKTERHFAEDQSKNHGNQNLSFNSMAAISMKKPHHISTYNDEILSENYDRSVKNSQVSQMTHNADREEHYFYKEKRCVKKERKVVYLDQEAH